MDSKAYFNKRQTNIHVFVRKKTEKICAAFFLVTDALPEDDLFKHAIRTQGLALLEQLDQSNLSSRERHLETLISLCTTAQYAGVISAMNARILVDECEGLRTFVASHEETLAAGGMLSLGLFETMLEAPAVAEPEGTRHVSDTKMYSASGASIDTPSALHKGQGRNVLEKKQPKEENKEKQRDRRATILSVLQKKDTINVKDVAHVITDCSEKTLQRELLSLVAQGVLKKEGERRWSTYSLATGR